MAIKYLITRSVNIIIVYSQGGFSDLFAHHVWAIQLLI